MTKSFDSKSKVSKSLAVALVKDGEPFPVFCAPFALRIGNLAQSLGERGHRVTWHASNFLHYRREFTTELAVNSKPDQKYLIALHRAGAYYKNISPARWLHHLRLAFATFWTLLREPELDVIHCCVPTLESATVCWLVARLRNVPLILDVRDPWPEVFVHSAPPKLKKLVRGLLRPYFALAQALFRKADSLTAVSFSFLHWAQELSGRSTLAQERDRVFFLGSHDLLEGASGERSFSQEDSDLIKVVYIGGFSSIYEFETLRQALIDGLGDSPDFSFLLIGEGGDGYESLKSSLEGFQNVEFTGWLSRERAYSLALDCDVGLVPLRSELEGFLPNKPFEYASLGLPLLSSARGEVQSFVERTECGWFYETGDSKSLTERLLALKREPHLVREASRRARAFWESEGHALKLAERLADHVEMVAASRECYADSSR